MHDARNRPLKVGDTVLIPCTVKETHAPEDYCNVSVVTVLGRRPDAQKESFSAFNTAVVFRANKGDELHEPLMSELNSTPADPKR